MKNSTMLIYLFKGIVCSGSKTQNLEEKNDIRGNTSDLGAVLELATNY